MAMASEVSSLVGVGTSVGPLHKPPVEDVDELSASRGPAEPADSLIPDDSVVMTKFPRDGNDSLFPRMVTSLSSSGMELFSSRRHLLGHI